MDVQGVSLSTVSSVDLSGQSSTGIKKNADVGTCPVPE